jgi:hypothetical protein
VTEPSASVAGPLPGYGRAMEWLWIALITAVVLVAVLALARRA